MNKIRFLRNEAGLTTRELGEMLNYNYSNISRLELNKNSGMKNEVIKMFCDFFMVDPNYLQGFSDTGILCVSNDNVTYSLSEEEYNELAKQYDIWFNPNEGRGISPNGEKKLAELRSKEFDKAYLHMIKVLMSSGAGKRIFELLPRMNEPQLELTLKYIEFILKTD